jgi:hypothetical protein
LNKHPVAALVAALFATVTLAACQPAAGHTTNVEPVPDKARPAADPVDPAPAAPSEGEAVGVTASPAPTATPAAVAAEPPTPPQRIGPAPEDFPSGVDPLTGLTVDDPAVLNRRPLLIKISNAPEVVRPQSGTSFADVIFEYYVEGGWTRFAAIFYSHDVHHVGPVRSARLVDLQLTPALDAILAFSGASQGVTDSIRESDIYPNSVISPQFGYGEPWFTRFPREDLAWEHTLYTDTDLLWGTTEERGVNHAPDLGPRGFAFNPVPPSGGEPASTARLDYAKTSVSYQYDPVSGTYLRWTDGIAHTDALTGQQLGFENVILIGSTLEMHDLFPEKYFGAEQSLYIEMTGFGPATLLRDGQMFEGRWLRENEGDMLTFIGAGNEPLLLKPGHTMIHIGRTGFEQFITRP